MMSIGAMESRRENSNVPLPGNKKKKSHDNGHKVVFPWFMQFSISIN
jgi:hypothetical protein